jgi:hypothetical protein
MTCHRRHRLLDRTLVKGPRLWGRTAIALAALTAGVALLNGSLFAPENADAGTRACASPGSKTVRQTSQARIYRKRDKTVGCYRRTNRRTVLAEDPGFIGSGVRAEQLRVAGPYVGYSLASFGRGGTGSFIVVTNLRTGRYVRSIRGTPVTGMSSPIRETVTDLVIKSNGSIAWIWDTSKTVTFPELITTRTIQVRKSDRSSGRSSSTLLDSTLTVDTRSLAIRGSTISWRNAGQLRTATLR